MSKCRPFTALFLMAFLCACSGARRALKGVSTSAPTKDLSVAYVYSENTERSRAYFKPWRASGMAGAESDELWTTLLPEMMGRHFKTAAPAETLEKALASGADVVAVIDSWAEHLGFGLGSHRLNVKIAFLTPKQEEIETVESIGQKAVSPPGTTPLEPTAWASALKSLHNDAAAELDRAVKDSPKLAGYGRSRGKNAGISRVFHSDVDAPEYKRPPNADNFAVVVGVERYASLPEAQFAERDAEAVRAHLVAMGYPMRNIAFLTGHQATRTGLAKNLETWLPNQVTEKSTVFFYYSGHGSPAIKTGRAYLVPADGDPSNLEDTAYPLNRLYGNLNALKAKQIIVAMEVGTLDMEAMSAASSKIVSFAASDASQASGTDEDQGHGLFTYYFLRGLNGGAKGADGKVTAKSLFDYLSPNVADKAKRSNRDQTPTLSAPEPDRVVLLSD